MLLSSSPCYFVPLSYIPQLSIHSRPQSRFFIRTESSSIIMNIIIIFISIIIIMQFVLRSSCRLFHSELSTECDLVLPLVTASISFPESHPVAALVPSAVPSITCFSKLSVRTVCLVLLGFLPFILCSMFILSFIY